MATIVLKDPSHSSDITVGNRGGSGSRLRTNQYNQDLGLVHSTNDNHLESPNEGSSIDHQVTTYLHAQNITMFPTNETWDTASRGPTTIVTPKSQFRTDPSDHGFPGFSAGRGVYLAGGAPGGG
ncbi:galactose oxidase [Dorcoceras hygrometricum]|uniref:Galactose oxidase n=1 Tax=Dorcoceras hygrometricum TaxID=472368 RepID=A0A2Z7CRB0_9LAMI|nr:galactose oxidase [Dorcoceras hygrometricum]